MDGVLEIRKWQGELAEIERWQAEPPPNSVWHNIWQAEELYCNDTLVNTRYYISKYYEKEKDSANVNRYYHYIYGDNGVVALYISGDKVDTAITGGEIGEIAIEEPPRGGNIENMYYIHTDHLGSYIAITNANAKIVQRNLFDVWGNPIPVYAPTDTLMETPLNFAIIDRGFTGHEHYPQFRIINMNGRLYDPVIGRMFSPDKYVANGTFTQDYNRYSYARNNPLMYVDPDGNIFFYIFPTLSWSKEGGLSIGITAGIGIPGLFNVSASIGYNFKHNDFSASVGVTAAFNTLYASYSTQSGFSVGWTVGMTSYAGFPISSNIATVGVNYNFTNKTLGGNISAFQWQQGGGWSFNPSLSVAIYPEQFTNLVKGQGFRSNSEVFDRMMSGEATRRGDQFTCQQILNYFGFRGTYDPSITSPGATDEKGRIFYGNSAFEGNYSKLALVAYHELRHSQNVKTGKYKGLNLRDEQNPVIRQVLAREDWDAYSYSYRNQGLYPNSGEDIVYRIRINGMSAGMYGPGGNDFVPQWWHFIYEVPRLW